ncbi:MAG: chemotaxis protein CheD [Candidatus Riflebacteria bacterium]|nr:chemotaxis protein CheD [Candidatus Riflebacteria bacterium]
MITRDTASPQDKEVVHVTIGDFYATSKPVVLQTVLGSCVSACLFDPVHKVAGMNHILLPGKADIFAYDENSCYGISAMERLINEITRRGGVRTCLKAKIFGGGHVLATASLSSSTGMKNVDFVLNYLQVEKIPLISQNTGGSFTRRIFFHTDSFDVFVKRIPAKIKFEVTPEEEELAKRIQEQIKKPDDIEFF